MTFKGFRPTCSRPRGAGTFRLTASRPMSAPGHGFSPGRRLRVSIRGVFLFLPPWRPIGSWARGRTPRASSRSGPRFPLPTSIGTSRIRLRRSSPLSTRSPRSATSSSPTSVGSSTISKSRQQGYGSALAFHLTNALFQTACRFEELIQLTWSDCQRVGEEIVALRIKGKGSVFQDVPVPGRLSAALLEWKALQEKFKGRRIMAPGGIAFAASQFVFAGYSGAPFSNRAFNLRLRAACRALGVGEITAHGLRHSAATILLNQVGKDLREIQELLRHKNIRTTVRYTHVGYEQTRQTAEALSDALE